MIREITREDLGGLMSLYAQLHAEPAPEDARRARDPVLRGYLELDEADARRQADEADRLRRALHA